MTPKIAGYRSRAADGRWPVLLACALCVLCGARWVSAGQAAPPPAVRPEVAAAAMQEYEFAKALMDRREPSFSTDDLVERLIARLDESPATKLDAKLIKATLRRRQVADVTPEKAVDLLTEADQLFRDVAAAPSTYPLLETAKREAESIRKDVFRYKLKVIKNDPTKSIQVRQELAAMIEKGAAANKAEADAALPKFLEAFKKYEQWQATNNKERDESREPPREITGEVEKWYDAWIIADFRYFLAKIEQLETYDEADAARKPLADELGALCQKRVDDDNVVRFAVILARYYYLQGRIFAAVGDEEKAGKAWKEALSMEGAYTEEQKRQIFLLKKQILHDLVKLKMRMKRYSDVEETIGAAETDSMLKIVFEEDLGKELLMDCAWAIVRGGNTPEDYTRALQKMREAIGREQKKGANTIWANEFSRTMAEILIEARTNKIIPTLSADEWFNAAHGFYLLGQFKFNKYELMAKTKEDAQKIKAQYEDAYGEFQNAVDYYRHAIAVARLPEQTDLLSRLTVEPKAWSEMGACYLRMKHYYEAIIVYKAMRDWFLDVNRVKWMPDRKLESRLYTKPVLDALAELDKPKEQGGMLVRAGLGIMYALRENEKIHKDSWNSELSILVLGDDKRLRIDVFDVPPDMDYDAAEADMKVARSLTDNAKAEISTDVAQENYTAASAKYLSAADRLGRVTPGKPAYEFALVQMANCYTQAQDLWSSGKIVTKKPDEADAKAKDLAQKALAAFEKYDGFVAQHPATTDKDKARRKSLEGVVLLARNTLSTGASNWETVVKTADAYLAWDAEAQQQKNPPRSQSGVALFNKFRAVYELSTTHIAPECDSYLVTAEDVMKRLHQDEPKNTKVYLFMLNSLSRRYTVAAYQLQDQIKKNPMADMAKLEEGVAVYDRKVADLQSERLKVLDETKAEEVTLDDYSRLVYLYNKTHQFQKAADTAILLLAKFDPQKKNYLHFNPDDEKVWPELLTKMEAVIKYSDLKKWDQCKKDHETLVDYMYDTTEGAQLPQNDPHRPAIDKYNMDLEKASSQFETIKRNYPDCQTFKMSDTKDGKPFMAQIDEEIDFRRKIEATRDLLSRLALDMGNEAAKRNEMDRAQGYWDQATEQLNWLIKFKGDSPATKNKIAMIKMMGKKYEEALEILFQVRTNPDVNQNSEIYFEASKMMSEVYRIQGKWFDAAEYPLFIVNTAGPARFQAPVIKERWPDMEPFLEECFEHGVPRPAFLNKKLAPELKKDEGAAVPGQVQPEKAEAPAAEGAAKNAAAEPTKDAAAANPVPPPAAGEATKTTAPANK